MRIRSAVSVYHQTDDLFICLPHPVFAQPADPADRGFRIFHDDPVTAFKFLIIFIHIVTENSGVHGKSDLCRAGCLCPVADDAGDNGKGVDNCVDDRLVIASAEIYDPGSRACTCAHGAAVGRERADPGFLVDGYQV